MYNNIICANSFIKHENEHEMLKYHQNKEPSELCASVYLQVYTECHEVSKHRENALAKNLTMLFVLSLCLILCT